MCAKESTVCACYGNVLFGADQTTPGYTGGESGWLGPIAGSGR